MRHLNFANIASGLSLFLVLTTGTAMAVAGSNTIFSDDIVNGEVTTADLAGGAVTAPKIKDHAVTQQQLAAPRWRKVTTAAAIGNACASQAVSQFCGNQDVSAGRWLNYGNGFQSARFYKDVTGQVHLEGLVTVEFGGAGDFGLTIFRLPPGFRPSAALVFSVDCAGVSPKRVEARIDVFQDGAVQLQNQDDDPDTKCYPADYLSLSGIAFRAGA